VGWLGWWCTFAAAFGLISVLLEVHLGKALWWDTLNYEYYTGWAFIHGFGSRYALPGQLQSYLDPQQNAVYYLLIRHLSPLVEGITVALAESLGLALLALVGFLAARRASWSTWQAAGIGLVAGAAGLLSPIYRSELGGTMGDTMVAAGLIGAAGLLYASLSSADAVIRLRCALGGGVLLGFTLVAKFTTLTSALALLLAFGVALALGRGLRAPVAERVVAFGLAAASSVVVAVALYAPLGLTVWRRYQNPFFPYYNGIAGSPLQQPGNFQDHRFEAHGVVDVLHHLGGLVIGTHSLESGTYLQRSPILVCGAAVLLVLLVDDLWRRRSPTTLLLETATVLAFVLWCTTDVIYRYAAPLEMSMGAVLVVVMIERTGGSRVLVLLAAAAVLVLGALGGQGVQVTRVPFGSSFFDLDTATLTRTVGGHVIFVGGAPTGYVAPSLPAGTDVVRVGGNLTLVMSERWWGLVRSEIEATPRSWSVIEAQGQAQASTAELATIGVVGTIQGCLPLAAESAPLEICHLSIG
jgi:hypothetical protein